MLQHPELIRLPQRAGGTRESEDNHEEHEGGAIAGGSFNPHLWLDPQNAIKISHLLADALAELDPINRSVYQQNAQLLQIRLEKLDQTITQQLQPVSTLPYLVFHDAYPYFEQRYNLKPLDAISISPDHRTGAMRIARIRK